MSGSNALAVARRHATTWPAETPPQGRARPQPLTRTPLTADLSCGLGALLTALAVGGVVLPEHEPGYPAAAYWAGGLITALGIVGSLLIHQLGHAAAARWVGLDVVRIRLSFGSGLSDVTLAPEPRQELFAAAGGPTATLVVAVAAVGMHVALVETIGPGLPATLAALIALANVGLLVFNAMPGLPLDGGHVLHAAIWAATRRPATATRVAAAIGRGVGDTMLGIGLLGAVFGFIGVATGAAFLGLVIRLRTEG